MVKSSSYNTKTAPTTPTSIMSPTPARLAAPSNCDGMYEEGTAGLPVPVGMGAYTLVAFLAGLTGM